MQNINQNNNQKSSISVLCETRSIRFKIHFLNFVIMNLIHFLRSLNLSYNCNIIHEIAQNLGYSLFYTIVNPIMLILANNADG